MIEDDQGFLHDPGVRAAMGPFALDGDTLALEAAAAVRSAAQAVDRLRGHGAGGRGLSAGALDVLVRLNTGPEEGLTIGELARAAGVSSRNVTGLVDTLAGDGLVERVPDKRDRRSVRVRVTTAGREWLAAFRAPTNRAMDALFSGFTTDELSLFRHLCLRLVENQRRIEQHLNADQETT
ncbi:MarR family transcriptional regulator [Umezawaea sp. Da 62-37]|uniref:MarR family winged helix-turn-helix transcriptional regulator n=1 Tax=Umezawaea sp. Da 62-37 TaxID=3075927 RepID=UPI0028F6E426|nr:MarR family transcriptional regulator [Umezawaea sp. Da 62-37]WNV83600.1 MarR family transcriptional regulator [Umezawaea sp. Da 62-37]